MTAKRRLFVGLMAPANVQAELSAYQWKWTWSRATKITPPERLHITLAFLGDVDAKHEAALCSWLDSVKVERFDLTLGKPALFEGGIAVVTPSLSAALDELQEKVAAVAAWSDVGVERKPWVPHVTLARNVDVHEVPSRPLWVRWPVRGFELVCSSGDAYQVLRTWKADDQ